MSHFVKLLNQLRTFRHSSLFMNALYLMLSTFVVAVCGFLFWVLVARTYDTAAVGLATTLLSVSSLLSLLSMVGFDTTFVRFLPRAEHKETYMHSGLIIVALASTVLAFALALILPLISPNLAILSTPWSLLAFVFFTAITSLNVLTNAIFLAFKQAKYIFIINSIFSVIKVLLAVCVVAGDAVTIFILAGGAQLVGLLLSLAWLKRTFDYSFAFKLDWQALHVVRKFSFSMYVSSVLNLLPPTLLPLIIIYHLGPKSSAYYYMAFTIAGVLYTIAYASMQSVFAEGSHDETSLADHLRKAAVLILVLLLPASIITAIVSGFLLNAFGQNYARNASELLQLFALGALPVAVYSAMGAIFKVHKNLRAMVSMNIVYTLVILVSSYVLISGWGLVGIGWAWIIGNVTACVVGTLFLLKQKGGQTHGTIASTRR